jgi:prepilin signal peptidase PulO-like enzyme (type II secretory pathway)
MGLLLVAGIAGALMFGVLGRLGAIVADTYVSAADADEHGPPAVAIPGWAYVAVSAGIGFLVGIHGIDPLRAAVLIGAVFALNVCAASDARTGILPDAFTVGPLVAVLAVSAFDREWTSLAGATFVVVPFAVLAAFSRGRGMGWGDVKLAALGGALVGMAGIVPAVGAAALAACLVQWAYARPHRPIAFGPYLAGAIGLSLGFGTAF